MKDREPRRISISKGTIARTIVGTAVAVGGAWSIMDGRSSNNLEEDRILDARAKISAEVDAELQPPTWEEFAKAQDDRETQLLGVKAELYLGNPDGAIDIITSQEQNFL